MAALERFLKYWLSLMRYSALKSSSFMSTFAKDLIETLYMSVVIDTY